MDYIAHEPRSSAETEAVDAIVDLLSNDPQALAEVSSRLAPATRDDGWSGFARRLFLEVLAETGRVSTACAYAQLTRQSAYALRARDPFFAAAWDAACELARQPLADALYEKALDGVTDTIVKDGEIVATRHRFDSRLSIAVLNRLDKRCDRAEERGSRHLAVAARWDECMKLVADEDSAAQQALLEPPVPAGVESAQQCQACQLAEGRNPIGASGETLEIDLSDRCWKDEIDQIWMTDFPPPTGFTGYESRPYGDDEEERYERACTPEEIALLDADLERDRALYRGEDEELRDAWFTLLRESTTPDEPIEGPGRLRSTECGG